MWFSPQFKKSYLEKLDLLLVNKVDRVIELICMCRVTLYAQLVLSQFLFSTKEEGSGGVKSDVI